MKMLANGKDFRRQTTKTALSDISLSRVWNQLAADRHS